MLSVIKLLAAAAVTTASMLSTPAAAELPFALCEDIEEIDTNVLAEPGTQARYSSGGLAPDPLLGFLRTYAEEHPDTYAGLWYSREWGGTLVLAFADDPKPHLEAIRRRRPRETDSAYAYEARDHDWTVDVVQVAHSDSELKALQERVRSIIKRAEPDAGSARKARKAAKLEYERVRSIIKRVLPDDPARAAKLEYYETKLRAFPPDAPIAVELGYIMSFSRLSPRRGRVQLHLWGHRSTVEYVAAMARTLMWDPRLLRRRHDADEVHGKVCVWGPFLPTLDDRLKVRFAPMADAGADPLVDCQRSARAPLSTFTGEPDIPAGSDDPLHILLRTQALPPTHTAAPAEGWRTLARDGKRATFYWTDGDRYKVRTYVMTRAGWFAEWDTSGVGECGPRLALPEGLQTVYIHLDTQNLAAASCDGDAFADAVARMWVPKFSRHPLDPRGVQARFEAAIGQARSNLSGGVWAILVPPDPDSTTLHLLVSQNGCAGGWSGAERMLKPEVIESATEIRLAMGVIPSDDGGTTCPSNAVDPITIELAAPIGQRKIVDGLSLPPRPLE